MRPECSFASDNAAPAHPAVLEAMLRANVGHRLAYGDDDETRRCQTAFCELFDRDLRVLPVFNGTGANVMTLADQLRCGEAVICSEWAHINCDETLVKIFHVSEPPLNISATENVRLIETGS